MNAIAVLPFFSHTLPSNNILSSKVHKSQHFQIHFSNIVKDNGWYISSINSQNAAKQQTKQLWQIA